MKNKIFDVYNSIVHIRKISVRDQILRFFLQSGDFNGISSNKLCERFSIPFVEELENLENAESEVLIRYVSGRKYDIESLSFKKLFDTLKDLVANEIVTIVFDDNPHIKRYPDQPKEKQFHNLDKNFLNLCFYPSSKYLEELNPKGFEELPFKRKMLLGCPQVYPVYFELKILSEYENDPRFRFDFSDYSGHASIKEEYDSSTITLDRDRTFIECFGIGYKENDYRRVAILWVTDLARFTSEHQKRWDTYRIDEDCFMDPDFYKNQVVGDWADKVGIYTAFLEEIKTINKICEKADWPNLFKHEYEEHPSGFHIPFDSTSQVFYNFCRLLDKLITENINTKFFDLHLVENEKHEKRINSQTGHEEVVRLGTIVMLERFIKKRFKPINGFDDVDEMIKVFKKIRRLRSDESHSLLDNRFHHDYEKMHDKLMLEAYGGLRLLRLIISNEPSVKQILSDLVPDWLFEGKIRSYFFYTLNGIEAK